MDMDGFQNTTDQVTSHIYTAMSRAGRRSLGTIVLLRERTERSRTIPSFRKKNECIERVLKNIGTICKGTEQERNDLAKGPSSGTERNNFKKAECAQP